jgi:hypothetical protein
MKPANNLFAAFVFTFAAVASGCAADVQGPDSPDNPDNPDDPDDPLPPDVDASGRYQLQSQIDLAANAPGKVGEIVREFVLATDEQGVDPTKWILEKVVQNISSGTIRNAINAAIPFVSGYLNDRLLEIAPNFVDTIITVGNDFGEVSKNFGLSEQLELTKSGSGYTAKHTVLGARFKVNNVESEYPFADFNTPNVIVENVAVTLDPPTGKLTLADHKVGLAYGKVLRIALDGAIIPSLDPTASNLGELLANLVNCQVVGEQIDAAVRDLIVFSPGVGVFKAACDVGLQKAADLIYGKMTEIDGNALELGITGVAKALDRTGDKQIDTIQTGKWDGTMSYAGSPATLTGATFFGARM